jgi:hypothetical protein
MSAVNEVVVTLLALGAVGCGVLVWAIWPTPKRVQRAARAVQRKRRGATVVRVDPVATEPAPEPLGEPEVPAAPETDPESVQPSPADPAWWGFPPGVQVRWTASPDEPTPLFHAPGKHRYPDDLDMESFTGSWSRAALRALLDMDEEEAA